MYELVEEAAKVLRNPTEKFDFDNPQTDPKELQAGLVETMGKYGGLGLSANQVGVDLSVFVMQTQDEGIVAFFNPELVQISQETEMMKEGCLSFPEIKGDVARPELIIVQYQDLDGNPHKLECDGLLGRCIQHEVDHLNGILFTDRMETDVFSEIKSEVQMLKKNTKNTLKKKKGIN